VNDGLRARIGEAWAFRSRVERDAASRFARLEAAISAFDADSPVPAMLTRAAQDEERHAVLCAELAAAYGQPSDGGLSNEAIAPRQLGHREQILYEVVAACCITETESVATLATLLAEEGEPRVREVLHEIARDEVVHGRMGWAHLAREAALLDVTVLSSWIPAMLAGTVGEGLFTEADAEDEAQELLRHGVLPPSRKREIFVRTLEEVVFPGLEKLGVDPAPARAWLEARKG
jgi:hypothetical protein